MGTQWVRRLIPFTLLAPALQGCATAGGGAPRAPSVAEVVDSVATTPPLERTHWGVELYDPDAGRVVLAHNAEKHFVPASNMKLIVTAVALAELGPGYRYRTPVYAPPAEAGAAAADTADTAAAGVGAADATAADAAATGAATADTAAPSAAAPGVDSIAAMLVVAGRGDPTLSARFHPTDRSAVEMLADSVYRAGVRRIGGDVVIDASYFDDEWVHASWEVGDLPWYYAAPVAAFGIAEGAAPVVVEPGPMPGAPAVVTSLEPAAAFEPRNGIVTDTAGADTDFEVERRPFDYVIDFSGTVAADAEPDTLWFAVAEPALFAGRALAMALERRGIPVDGDVRVVYDPVAAAALVPDTLAARRVALWQSPPLSEIVAAILKPSQNWIAETLLKTLGAEVADGGTWAAGIEVERRYLFDVVGIDSAAVVPVDGSGLSAQNLLTPHAVVQLLTHARAQPWGDAYRAALAVPGEEAGTLEERLERFGLRISAKTGTIRHVNSLSGYLVAADGRDRVFSILTNASGIGAGRVRAAIDTIAAAMANAGGRR